jgi:hypothetical protein
VSVINTSNATQVIKVRLRRATDSMDALDFNVVLSPYDVWTGYVENNEPNTGVEDQIRFYSNDKSCTVPAATPNPAGPAYFAVPDEFKDFAEEGYIEIIGMGQADVNQAISKDALHVNGVPTDCAALQSNFLAYGVRNVFNPTIAVQPAPLDASLEGNINSEQTASGGELSNYTAPGNFMKVSYFIKDSDSGIEMGDNAVMISDFMDGPSMTNQLAALLGSEDLQGYDYPDLNGGAPLSFDEGVGASDTRFELLRGILGSRAIINDWSKNTSGDFTVDTDWVVTAPGQYTMLKTPEYIASLTGTVSYDPTTMPAANAGCAVGSCDNRDLPLTITPIVFDREEQSEVVPPDEIVISPTPSVPVPPGTLPYEVNVIEWGLEPVLDAGAATTIDVTLNDAQNGWAQLELTSASSPAVCQYTVSDLQEPVCTSVSGEAPIVGFAAWQRNFGGNPDANYGRIVAHSYATSSGN